MGSGQGGEGGIVGQLLEFGLIESVFQGAVSGEGGEVEDRAGGGGDGIAIAGRESRSGAARDDGGCARPVAGAAAGTGTTTVGGPTRSAGGSQSTAAEL